jgi:uncharacterized protein
MRNFFADGIRFTCTDCGACCTGAPGLVQMTDAEVDHLAAHLQMDRTSCEETYLKPFGTDFRVREKANGDCIFFDGRCTVYPVRPLQCRTYPFWFDNLRSQTAWKATVKACPGIGEGRLYTEEEILELLHQDMERN